MRELTDKKTLELDEPTGRIVGKKEVIRRKMDAQARKAMFRKKLAEKKEKRIDSPLVR